MQLFCSFHVNLRFQVAPNIEDSNRCQIESVVLDLSNITNSSLRGEFTIQQIGRILNFLSPVSVVFRLNLETLNICQFVGIFIGLTFFFCQSNITNVSLDLGNDHTALVPLKIQISQ